MGVGKVPAPIFFEFLGKEKNVFLQKIFNNVFTLCAENVCIRVCGILKLYCF